MYYTTNVLILFHMFFSYFIYWNFDIGMFVLGPLISVQKSKKYLE